MANVNLFVQPLAWLFDGGALPPSLRLVYALRMPTVVVNALRGLSQPDSRVAPISSLHDLLAAASHNVIAFAPNVLKSDINNPRWLYIHADHSLDVYRLLTLLKAWLNINYPAQAQGIIQEWENASWVWDQIDLADEPALQPLLLPGLIVRWLLEQPDSNSLTLPDKDGDSHLYSLRLVPLMSMRNTAELVTEPQRNDRGAYSFVLRFWLENIPYTGQALFMGLSTRRWFTELIGFLAFNRNKGVYLRQDAGYLERDAFAVSVFSRIRLRNLGGTTGIQWVGTQAKVFKNMAFGDEFPEASVLYNNPADYFDRFLIVKKASERERQELPAGLWSNDHRAVFQQVTDRVQSWALPVPVWTREARGDGTYLGLSDSQRSTNDVKPEIRRRALSHLPAPHPVRIEVYADNFSEIKQVIAREVGITLLDGRQADDDPLYICADDQPDSPCMLEVVRGTKTELVSLLPESGGTNKQASSTASRIRRTQISRMFPRAEQPTGLLVSLPRYDKSRNPTVKLRDPKNAIRLGLIDSGRASQFIVPDQSPVDEDEDNNYSHRLTSAVRDLLYTLGYRLNPLYERLKDTQLPAQVDILAFAIIQLNARNNSEQKVFLPLVLAVPAGTHALHVYLPRDTGEADLYCSLPEALNGVACINIDYPQEVGTLSFFKNVIQQYPADHPVLLLLADQNLRRVFNELDRSPMDVQPLSLNGILNDKPQIRVARLRYSYHQEAPFCVPVDPRSKYQGLYTPPEVQNLFYSLHNVGARHVLSEAYRMDRLEGEQFGAVNPSTMHILLANMQPGDVPAEWAGVVHRLRLESSHTDIATRLPQPLHTINKISEYLSRYAGYDAQSEDEDDEDDRQE